MILRFILHDDNITFVVFYHWPHTKDQENKINQSFHGMSSTITLVNQSLQYYTILTASPLSMAVGALCMYHTWNARKGFQYIPQTSVKAFALSTDLLLKFQRVGFRIQYPCVGHLTLSMGHLRKMQGIEIWVLGPYTRHLALPTSHLHEIQGVDFVFAIL